MHSQRQCRTESSKAEIPNFTVEIPAETTHGDFASNAAMVSARTFRNAPVKIANILKEEMDFSTARYIDRVEIAGPGFINFFVSPLWFADIVSGVLAAKRKTTVVPITARAKRL